RSSTAPRSHAPDDVISAPAASATRSTISPGHTKLRRASNADTVLPLVISSSQWFGALAFLSRAKTRIVHCYFESAARRGAFQHWHLESAPRRGGLPALIFVPRVKTRHVPKRKRWRNCSAGLPPKQGHVVCLIRF